MRPLVASRVDRRGSRGSALELARKAHWAIDKVTADIERFQFNTAIAALMELVNDIYRDRDELPATSRRAALSSAVTTASLLFPFAPHLGGGVRGAGRRARVGGSPGRGADAALLRARHGHPGRAGERQGARQHEVAAGEGGEAGRGGCAAGVEREADLTAGVEGGRGAGGVENFVVGAVATAPRADRRASDRRGIRRSGGSVRAGGAPGISDEAIRWLTQRLRLRPGATVLDLAAGNRVKAATLLHGADVVAVEPWDKGEAGRDPRRPLPRRHRRGDPLGGEADAVTVGQAFHWFDGDAALREIHRVLRPDGALALLWNVRRMEDPIHAAIEEVVVPPRRERAAPSVGVAGGVRAYDPVRALRAGRVRARAAPGRGRARRQSRLRHDRGLARPRAPVGSRRMDARAHAGRELRERRAQMRVQVADRVST